MSASAAKITVTAGTNWWKVDIAIKRITSIFRGNYQLLDLQ